MAKAKPAAAPKPAAKKKPAPKPFGSSDPAAASLGWPGPLLARRRILKGLEDQGVSRAVARKSLGGFGDGSILQWFKDYGGDILKIVLMLLPLFLGPKPETTESGA